MQILPTNISEMLTVPSINTAFLDDERTGDFLDVINDALTRENEEEDRDNEASSANADTEALRSAVQVQTPYSRNSSNGVTYTLDEVCFTKQELQELRDELLKAGASPESLARLTALAELPDGANLAQVMASVKGNAGTPMLSDEDRNNMAALLGQVDPSGILNTNMQALIMEGQGREALDMLLSFAGQLDPSGSLDITRGELVSLGRGLGLDSAGLASLAEAFGGNESISLLNGQLAALLAPASQFFDRQKAEQETLDKALSTTLQQRISAARARTEKERKAGELQSREAMQSKVHIDRTVQQRSREILEDVLAGAQEEAQQAAADGRLGQSMAEQDAKFAAQQQPDGIAPDAQQPHFADLNSGGRRHDGTAAGDGGKDNRNASGWNDILGKTDVKPAAPRDGQAIFGGMQPQQPAGSAARTAAETAPLNRQAVQDVTQAMLSSLRDGGKRMDLQLTSQELGSLTVTLTVRNGEVNALIRSEKSETADMLQRQLDYIRVNLEEQGLKVDKVEVQLQSQDEQNQLWQDLDQHNFQQEQQARREEFARLRTLATARNTSSNKTISSLEQPVHSSGETAIYAAGALNLVA